MTKFFGWSNEYPYSKLRTPSSDNKLFTTESFPDEIWLNG